MSPRHWTITTHVTGKEREVEVVLYDHPGEMRREASKFARMVGEGPGSFNDALGVCHGFQRLHIAPGGIETDDPLVSIIRLCRDGLNAKVVSHEVAHAAQHIYGIDHTSETDLAKDHMHAGNEEYAHLLGELFAAAWGALGSPTSIR